MTISLEKITQGLNALTTRHVLELPPKDTERWVDSKKAAVLRHCVKGEFACATGAQPKDKVRNFKRAMVKATLYYDRLGIVELERWAADFAEHGIEGLQDTKIQNRERSDNFDLVAK